MGAVTDRGRAGSRWALVMTALVLGACSGSSGPPDTATPLPDQPPGDSAPIVDWTDPDKTVTFDNGWTVHACEGDAPLLCVEKHGTAIGVVEALAYQVDSLEWFDPALSRDQNLSALAEEFARALGSDRALGCGSDYVFDPFSPEPFVLSNTPGVFFGFSGTMPDGDASELILQYATLIEDRIISIVATAYDEGGCPGRDELGGFQTAQLAEFRPHLEAMLYQSPLPEVDR